MPLIEVLPQSTAASSAPGWAYVPDTGYDPSKAAIIPSGARQRKAARGAGHTTAVAGDELSARQQNKITAYIESLQKDSLKDVQIVLHNKARDLASRGLRGKMTPAVRKIVQSQKTFANHLADEEAALALQQQQAGGSSTPQQTTVPRPPGPRSGVGRPPKGGRKVAPPATPPTHTAAAATPAREGVAPDTMEIDSGPAQSLHDEPAQQTQQRSRSAGQEPLLDVLEDPFLRPHVPRLPTPAELDALLCTPALSYTAARAAPSASTLPRRQFCSMCGYWGRVRCLKCGARVCGLDCKLAHEEGKCLKF